MLLAQPAAARRNFWSTAFVKISSVVAVCACWTRTAIIPRVCISHSSGGSQKNKLARGRVVHLIDPNAPSHTVAFNPLDRSDTNTQFSVISEAMFEAFERMWSEDGNSKPTIQRVMTATFTALGELGLTLAEARLLFDPDDANGVRSLVLTKLEDSYAYDEIEYLHRIGFEKAGRRDFRAEVIGPLDRIAKLVRTEAVRAIVGQTERLLDLREALDKGHIILANLSGGEQVYEQGADLLGRLLTRFLFFHARRRRKPHVPYLSISMNASATFPAIFRTFWRKFANTASASCSVINGWRSSAAKMTRSARRFARAQH